MRHEESTASPRHVQQVGKTINVTQTYSRLHARCALNMKPPAVGERLQVTAETIHVDRCVDDICITCQYECMPKLNEHINVHMFLQQWEPSPSSIELSIYPQPPIHPFIRFMRKCMDPCTTTYERLLSWMCTLALDCALGYFMATYACATVPICTLADSFYASCVVRPRALHSKRVASFSRLHLRRHPKQQEASASPARIKPCSHPDPHGHAPHAHKICR